MTATPSRVTQPGCVCVCCINSKLARNLFCRLPGFLRTGSLTCRCLFVVKPHWSCLHSALSGVGSVLVSRASCGGGHMCVCKLAYWHQHTHTHTHTHIHTQVNTLAVTTMSMLWKSYLLVCVCASVFRDVFANRTV